MSESAPSSVAVRVPGGALLQVVPLAAIGILVLNDHFLKERLGGVVTGKLSDFAGLAFFPLFLQSLAELAAQATRSKRLAAAASSLHVTSTCCVCTAVVFVLVKTWSPAGEVYRVGLGAIQYAIRQLLVDDAIFRRVRLTADTTDLVALPAIWLAYWAAKRRVI